MRKLLLLVWITSLIATGGSLYFSEVLGFIPCDLCWYQRILMYPLTILFGIAYFKKDYNIYKYVLPISILGMMTSTYHYILQNLPEESGSFCTSGCTGRYINWFGFVTIPFLCLIAFTIVTTILILLLKKNKKEVQ